jgi:hypothetical protein
MLDRQHDIEIGRNSSDNQRHRKTEKCFYVVRIEYKTIHSSLPSQKQQEFGEAIYILGFITLGLRLGCNSSEGKLREVFL